jgi:hypothetical protein
MPAARAPVSETAPARITGSGPFLCRLPPVLGLTIRGRKWIVSVWAFRKLAAEPRPTLADDPGSLLLDNLDAADEDGDQLE